MEFGALLKKTLKENSVPVTRLSSDIGCTRVSLYSVFNGEKKLSEDTFKFILNTYDFSPLQASELKRLFYLENIGESQKELLFVLKDELETTGKIRPFLSLPLKEIAVCNEETTIVGSAEYYSAIAAFLENEALCKNNVIYTNYSFFDIQADNMLYDFAINNKENDVLIKHTVRMGGDIDIKERLHNVFSSVKFAKLGHITNASTGGKKNFTFATYFIGAKTVIQYDNENECGFLTGEKAIVDAFRLAAMKNEKKKTVLTGFCESVLDLKEILTPLQKNMVSFLDFRFPANIFTTKKILSETVKDNVPYRDFVIEEFWNHLKKVQSSTPHGLFSQLGLQRFARDGIASDASPEFLHPISTENRIVLFKKYKESVVKNNYCLKIMNSDAVRVTEHFAIEIYKDGFSVLFCSEVNSKENFIGGCYIIYHDAELSKLFTDFEEYIVLSDGTLSKKYAELLIDDLIGQCESVINNG